KAVMGGFYIIEIDVVEMGVSHDLGIRPHVHMLLETVKPARSKPINVTKGDKAWQHLTGQCIEVGSLTKYTRGNGHNVMSYVLKQLQGESEIKILQQLAEFINTQQSELKICNDVRHEKLHRAFVQELEEYTLTAERLRGFIVQVYNDVLHGVKRREYLRQW